MIRTSRCFFRRDILSAARHTAKFVQSDNFKRSHSCPKIQSRRHSNLIRQKPLIAIENKIPLSFGVDEQFTNLPFQGYGSSLWMGSSGLGSQNERRRMLSVCKPYQLHHRYASTTNKVTLSSKFKPALSNAKQKSKEGWANFISQVDVSKYQDRKWYIRPISDIYFSWCFSKLVCHKVSHALKHMAQSFKLFALNCAMAYRITRRIFKGEEVSVIDRNRLKRAIADIFLMVPFSVFVIIPGAEVFIPFYIKRFPSALPSTFETADQKNDRQIKAARARIELATFMHETLDEMVRKQKATTSAKMLDFIKFVKEVRQNGRWITNEDFKKYAPLFQDELTIDKMDRPTLLALCKIFKTNPVRQVTYTLHGEFTQSTQLIRQVLKRRIHELKGEDQAWIELIKRNGIKNVPDEDLQELSRDRGMRAIGLTRERLEKQYEDWIELSSDPNISDSMLAYTRMLYMPRAIDKMGAAMETAIEKKVAANPARVEPKKKSEDNLQYSDRLYLEPITKSDFEIFAASIRAAKRELKPASSTKDYIIYKSKKLDHEIEEDREEGISGPVLDSIEKLVDKAQDLAEKANIESEDCPIARNQIKHELEKRGMSTLKVEKMIDMMDQSLNKPKFMQYVDKNQDGVISLEELEDVMDKILIKIDQNSQDVITFDEFTKLIEQIRQEDFQNEEKPNSAPDVEQLIKADSGNDITDDIASEISSSSIHNPLDSDEQIVTETPQTDSFDNSSSVSSKTEVTDQKRNEL